MEFKKFGQAVALAAAVAGGEACKTDEHPTRTHSASGRSEDPRALSSFGEGTQQAFGTWQRGLNQQDQMRATGVSIQSIEPVHVPNPLIMDSDGRLLRFQVTLSDGRVHTFDARLDNQVFLGDDQKRQWFSRGLDTVRSEVINFAQERRHEG